MPHNVFTPNPKRYFRKDLHHYTKLEDFELEAAWKRRLQLMSGNVLLIKGKGLPSPVHRLLSLNHELSRMNSEARGVLIIRVSVAQPETLPSHSARADSRNSKRVREAFCAQLRGKTTVFWSEEEPVKASA
jgi:hypothetical protein